MRFVVVGAGAVGGVVGGLLARSGQDVTLVARGSHLAAISDNGIRVRTPNADFVARPASAASTDEVSIGCGDIVMLAMKSQDTEAALRRLELTADPGAVIVCLQNGLDNERMAARRFADVLSIPVMLPAMIAEPGVVVAWGAPAPAVLDIGRWPDAPIDDLVTDVSSALVAAGMLSTPRHDIARWKRRKLIMNLGNAVQALLGVDGGRQLYRLATAEGEACFAAAGLALATSEEDLANRGGRMEIADVEGVTRGGGSSWQSLQRGAGTVEADYLNGEICLLGRMHGVATPVNDMLQRRANAAAAAGSQPGSVTEAELLAELA